MDSDRSPCNHRRLPPRLQSTATAQPTGLPESSALRGPTNSIPVSGRATPALRRGWTNSVHASNMKHHLRLTLQVARKVGPSQVRQTFQAAGSSPRSVDATAEDRNLRDHQLKFAPMLANQKRQIAAASQPEVRAEQTLHFRRHQPFLARRVFFEPGKRRRENQLAVRRHEAVKLAEKLSRARQSAD